MEKPEIGDTVEVMYDLGHYKTWHRALVVDVFKNGHIGVVLQDGPAGGERYLVSDDSYRLTTDERDTAAYKMKKAQHIFDAVSRVAKDYEDASELLYRFYWNDTNYPRESFRAADTRLERHYESILVDEKSNSVVH